jgi:hypothetical protein
LIILTSKFSACNKLNRRRLSALHVCYYVWDFVAASSCSGWVLWLCLTLHGRDSNRASAWKAFNYIIIFRNLETGTFFLAI